MSQKVRNNRYTSIVAVAKRARQLIEGSAPVISAGATKPVTIAIEELKSGKIKTKNKQSL